MNKKILEILVDKQNEKWPAIFNEILVILHRAYGWKNSWESFTFEITKIWNRIRFFLICPEKYVSFLVNQIYAHFSNVEISTVGDYLVQIPNDKILLGKITTKKHYFYSLKTFEDPGVSVWKGVDIDPFSSLTWALSKTGVYTLNTFQVNFRPITSHSWKKDAKRIIKILTSSSPNIIKKILLHRYFVIAKILFFPVILVAKLIAMTLPKTEAIDVVPFESDEKITSDKTKDILENPDKIDPKFLTKLSSEAYEVDINIISAWENEVEVRSAITEIASTLSVYTQFGQNSLKLSSISKSLEDISGIKERKIISKTILSTPELSGFVHLPTSYVKTPYTYLKNKF